MFIAIVTHNTGHGEVSNPFIISEYLPEVIQAVQSINEDASLHYEFHEDETGFVVYNIPMNKILGKLNFLDSIGTQISESYPVVFSKIRMGGKWQERWWNKHLIKVLVPRNFSEK
ncbi:MAG: hypothetical protein WCV80_00275 [Candidatus Paceibacterota bacterium]|jgi:hypothetical protein